MRRFVTIFFSKEADDFKPGFLEEAYDKEVSDEKLFGVFVLECVIHK